MSGFSQQQKVYSNIWQEIPSAHNDFIAQQSLLHGYDYQELVHKLNPQQLQLLLFTGELPTQSATELFALLQNALMCLGVRDNATRAAMVAGIGKSGFEQVLPTGLLAASGKRDGALAVFECYQFLQQHFDQDIPSCLEHAVGFDSYFGEPDPRFKTLFKVLNLSQHWPKLDWAQQLVDELNKQQQGWTGVSICAAICWQIGISARQSIGIYQAARAPGLFALGIEQSHFPLSLAPLLADEFYHYETELKVECEASHD